MVTNDNREDTTPEIVSRFLDLRPGPQHGRRPSGAALTKRVKENLYVWVFEVEVPQIVD